MFAHRFRVCASFALLCVLTLAPAWSTPLTTDVMVSDADASGCTIANPNTSRTVAVGPTGDIFIVYHNMRGVFVARSYDRGRSFALTGPLAESSREPEIAVDANNIVYVAWVYGGTIQLLRSTDRGATFSDPTSVGAVSGGPVHMATDAPYLYLIPRSGEALFINNASGEGSFTRKVTGFTNVVYADVQVLPTTHAVYALKDDPALSYIVSADRGATFGSVISPNGNVWHSTIAVSASNTAACIIVGGSEITGYRINTLTNQPETIMLGPATSSRSRSLAADPAGNLIDGYTGSNGVNFRISTDLGVTFLPPVQVAAGATFLRVAINPVTRDLVAVYEKTGKIYCSVYAGELRYFQPDLLARVGDGAWAGADLYGVEANQGVSARVAPGTTTTYALQVQNDCGATDAFVLRASPPLPGWTIRYRVAGIGDITSAVTGDGWQTPVLSGDGSLTLQAEVSSADDSTTALFCPVQLTAQSINDPTCRDEINLVSRLYDATFSRASLSSTNREANAPCGTPAMSADGRWVAFVSTADSLVSGDLNRVADVFVRDRRTGKTLRASCTPTGGSANDWSAAPALSADGRYLAFQSAATNLVAQDTNGRADIFVRDLQAGTTERVSGLAVQANGDSSSPTISWDGRLVAFTSRAANLVAGDTNGAPDVFLMNRQTRSLVRVSRTATGSGANGASDLPALSPDGAVLAFQSLATNLVSGDTNRAADVFLYTCSTGIITRVSLTATGGQADGASGMDCSPALSANGGVIVYRSIATNLVAGDTNGVSDVFAFERATGGVTRVSVATDGVQGNAESGRGGMAVSADGRWVAFYSAASALTPLDRNGMPDLFLRDRQTDNTLCMSVNAEGLPAGTTGAAGSPGAMSADGHLIVVETALALEASDTNSLADVYVRDRVGEMSSSVQADLLARAGQGVFTGDGIIGGEQQCPQTLGGGATGAYTLRLLNGGQLFDAFTLTAPNTGAHWQARFFAGGQEITTQVAGTGWTTPLLAPGASLDVEVQVTLATSAPLQPASSLIPTIVSTLDGTRTDSVELVMMRAPLRGVRLTTTPDTSAPQGSLITLVATPVGGMVIEYRFRVGIRSGGLWAWTTVRDFSPTATYPWQPPTAGAYTLVVLAREARTTALVNAAVSYTVTPPRPTSVALTVEPRTRKVGLPVILTAMAAGSDRVHYQFRLGTRTSTGWSWTVLQPYSATATCAWTPTTPGTFTLAVWARAEGSSQAYDVYKTVSCPVASQ
jgi:Tol biopolymer transport system component